MVESQPTRDIGRVFVGRQREMAELTAALDDAMAGQGRLVMVAGETCHLSPSFEAIHDVFSFTMERYLGIFAPSFHHQTNEDIVMGTLIPDSRPVPWIN